MRGSLTEGTDHSAPDMTDEKRPTNDNETGAPTLGLRCAWCGKVLRDPVGMREGSLAWTHGMCAGCQKIFEERIPTRTE